VTKSNEGRIRLDKSCRDCANFEQATESSGTCRVESRLEQTMKLVDFIACFFFKDRTGAA